MLYSNIDFSLVKESDEIFHKIAGIYYFLTNGGWDIHGSFYTISSRISKDSNSSIEIEIKRQIGTYLTLDNYKFFPKEESFYFCPRYISLNFKVHYKEIIPFDLMSQIVGVKPSYQILYYELNGRPYNTSLEFKINLARDLGLIKY